MIRKIYSLMVGTLLGVGALTAFGSGASAASLFAPAAAYADNPNIINVAKWDRDRDGSRCLYQTGECRHFYHGYYYETPWWTLPLVVGGSVGAHRYYDGYDDDYYYDDEEYDDGGWDDSHVQWCLNRYRSYNPRNNTWVSYSGQIHQCISPY